MTLQGMGVDWRRMGRVERVVVRLWMATDLQKLGIQVRCEPIPQA